MPTPPVPLTSPLLPHPGPSPLPPTETLEKAWIGVDWANKANIGPFGTILFLFYIIIHQLEPLKRVLGYEIKLKTFHDYLFRPAQYARRLYLWIYNVRELPTFYVGMPTYH